MKKINPNEFIIHSNTNFDNLPTQLSLDADKSQIEDKLKETRKSLSEIQNKLYAYSKYSVLVCIQGMDTSGKDSLIREVFKDFNVRGVNCYSFKKPSEQELKQNYLWRHYTKLPARGKFAVFNRSHYENVLITRVHPKLILHENLPNINNTNQITEDFWQTRLRQINQFEKTLYENGTIIFKFYLNISKEEQKHRLLRRLHKPEKNWKFNPGDLEERKLWEVYKTVYKQAILNTSKDYNPWYNIPSDDKKTARYLVAKILKNKMSSYTAIQYPKSNLEKPIDYYIQELENE